MQKKIIALAVAGLVSGAAFAQSNVTVYGIVDMAYQYNGSHTDGNVDSYSALDDGGWDSSRFGLKGTEDLGNGLSANFVQEYATHLDYNAGITARNSYVSLAGKNWGEVKLGSFGSVHDDYAGWSESGGMAWGNGVVGLIAQGDARNAVEYISPSFSGLQFKLGASSNYQNAQDVGNVDEPNNLRAFFGSAAYANGGLKIALTYDNVNVQNSDVNKDEWLIAGGYDFGMVKVGAAYDRVTVDNTALFGDVDRDAYRLTIGAPIGANGAIALSYTNASIDTDIPGYKNDADAWGISYSHFLSKRTALYASAYIGDFEDGGALIGTESGDLTTVTGYETGIKFGVRHTF